MAWQQVYQLNSIYSDFPVAIPYSFATNEIIIEITSTRLSNNSNHKAGLLWSVTNVPNVGITKGEFSRVYLARQKVNIDRVQSREYTLEFLHFHWISYLTLTFWEDLSDRYILDRNPPPSTSNNPMATNTNQNNNDLSGRFTGLF